MDPLTGAALLSAGQGAMQIGGNIIQNRANRREARKQRKWNEEQWQREADYNTKMFHLTNEYNSPLKQMERFKQAGLNPHLIYGKGSASAGTASALGSPSTKSYSRAEMQSVTKGVKSFEDYVQFKNIQAQTDNVRASTNLNEQQAILTAQKALTEASISESAKTKSEVDYRTKEYAVEMAENNLRKLEQETQQAKIQTSVDEKTKNYKVQAAFTQLMNQVKDGKLKDIDAAIKTYEIKLNKLGLTKGDSKIFRLGVEGVDHLKKKFNALPAPVKYELKKRLGL